MLSDEEKQAIEGLKGSQKWIRQQIRLGNLPNYNQGHYADIQIVLNLIEKQSKEIEEYKKQLDLDYVDNHFVPIERYNQLEKEIEELKKENLEIRDWKYVIDSPIDLDKLKELDLIKIKGKEYVSKDKLKAKIEELDEEIKIKREIAKNPMDRVSGRLLTDSIVELEKTKKVLQSLLEKE